jgi:hypothetical protein
LPGKFPPIQQLEAHSSEDGYEVRKDGKYMGKHAEGTATYSTYINQTPGWAQRHDITKPE